MGRNALANLNSELLRLCGTAERARIGSDAVEDLELHNNGEALYKHAEMYLMGKA